MYKRQSLIRAINVTTDSTGSVDVRLAVSLNSISYPICTASIPGSAGMGSTTPAVNLCDPKHIPSMDPIPNRGLFLTSGAKLQIALPTSLLASNHNLHVVVFGGDF